MNAIDVQQAIRSDYPLLYEKGEQYDFAERLGGCSDPLLAEIDAALREVWSARRALADLETLVQAAEKAIEQLWELDKNRAETDDENGVRGARIKEKHIAFTIRLALAAAVARVKGDGT